MKNLWPWLVLLILGFIFIFMIPRQYRVRATLLPTESKSAEMGGFMSNPLINGFLGGNPTKGSTEAIIAVLKSESVAHGVLDYDDILAKLLSPAEAAEKKTDPNRWTRLLRPKALGQLSNMTRVLLDPQGPIVLTITAETSDLGVEISRAYISKLKEALAAQTLTMAQKKRQFIQELLIERKNELQLVRQRLLNFDREGNILKLSPNMVRVMEDLSEIVQKESTIELYKRFISKHFPDRKEEIQALLQQEQKLLRNKQQIANTLNQSVSDLGSTETLRPSGRIPVVALEFQMMSIEKTVLEEVVAMLNRELEQARIDEAKEALSFQVLDEPLPKDIPDYPSRRQLVMIWSFLVGMALLVYILRGEKIRTTLNRGRQDFVKNWRKFIN